MCQKSIEQCACKFRKTLMEPDVLCARHNIKALTDRIRIQISYPNGQQIGFSFVTLTIQIDVPKSEQIRIIYIWESLREKGPSVYYKKV